MAAAHTLLLTVMGRQATQFGIHSEHAFAGADGTIGRSEDSDWVLSAAGISRTHAVVRYLNGIYFIEDRSTNGMLLNGRPLVKGDPAALKDGDQLQIDVYEVSVRLQRADDVARPAAAAPPAPPVAAPAASAPPDADPLDFTFLGGAPAPARDAGGAPAADSLIPGSGGIPGDLDPLSFLDAPAGVGGGPGLIPETPVAPASAAGWNHTSGMEDHFRPPATDAQRAANFLPDDWDPLADDAPVAPGGVGAAPASSSHPLPEAPIPAVPDFAAAASAPGAAPAAETGAVPAELQEIFLIVVDGVMDVLRARAEIKNSFRLPVTVIQRSENNPLKFAATADEALQKILAPTNTAFLSGTAAFEDAFNDIRCHQMAMLAGVRAAFESLLGHFSPDRYEHEVDGGKRSAFGGKGRYWDKYREDFELLKKDPDECFRRLFGDEFASAYEDQLGRLKSARRAGRSARR